MAHLIDASIFIELERRSLHVGALVDVAPDEPVGLASITASELLIGVYRANTPARHLRRETFVEGILGVVPVLPFDLRVARVHAGIWTGLTTTGQSIGANDLIIAATALAHGYAVLTQNPRDFQRVPGLVVRQPSW